jgi:integrase
MSDAAKMGPISARDGDASSRPCRDDFQPGPRPAPDDLRHSGATWRLNSGVPATEVAAWAGHPVEMLMRVYAVRGRPWMC